MTDTSPFSILLIQPPPVLSAMPPSTLTLAKSLFSGSRIKTCRNDAVRDGLTGGVNHLPELLTQLSARHDTIHFHCPDEINPARFKRPGGGL
jgi:hypothetical protein